MMLRSTSFLLVCLLLILGWGAPALALDPDLSGTWIKKGGGGPSRARGISRIPKGGQRPPAVIIEQSAGSISFKQRGSRGPSFVLVPDGQSRQVRGRTVKASWQGDTLVVEGDKGWRETWQLTGPGELTIVRKRPRTAPVARVLVRRQQ